MRALLLALCLALAPLPGPAQLSIFGVGESLVQFALRQISSEGFTVEARGIEDGEDGAAELVGVTVADRRGVWLEIEGVTLTWRVSRILLGELEIDRLSARGVRVLRAPEPEPTPAQEEPDAETAQPFAWPRAPIATRVNVMDLRRVEISPGVVAAQGMRFDARGNARDEGDEQAVALYVNRTDDVFGSIALDYLRDFSTGELRLDLAADEAAGGLVAELAGFPDDSATRVDLEARGPLTDWRLRFDAETDRVYRATGAATVVVGPPFSVDATAELRPGPAAPPAVAAALGETATLRARASENADGVIEIAEGRITAPELSVVVDGTFARETGAVQADVSLEAGAGLSALVEQVAFERVAFEGAVSGALAALRAQGALSLDGLRTAPVDLAAARLAADLTLTGAAAPSPEGFSAAFDVSGETAGLRLDRIRPETLGDATLLARGRLDDVGLTLDALRLAAPALTAEASGRLPAADAPAPLADDADRLDYTLAIPDLAPLAASYDVDAAGALAAQGRVTGALSAPRIDGALTLDGLAFAGEPYGRVALEHGVSFGEALAGQASLTAEGSRFGPAAASAGFSLRDARLDLSDISLDALGAEVRGALRVDLERTLAQGVITAELADLAPLSRLAGRPATGAASLTATLTPAAGRQDAALTGVVEGLSVADARIERLALDLSAADAFGPGAAVSGTLDAAGVAAAGAAIGSLTAEISGEDLQGAALGALSATARDVRYAAADASLAEVMLSAEGRDLIAAPKVEGTLAARDVAGAGAALARLAGEFSVDDPMGGGPAKIALTAEDFAYPAAEATVARLTLTADGADLIEAPSGSALLRAETVAGAGATLDGLTLGVVADDLTGEGGADVSLLAREIAYPAAEARVASVSLGGRVDRPFGDPAASFRLTALDVAGAGARVARIEAQGLGSGLLSAPQGRIDATLSAPGFGDAASREARLTAAVTQADGAARLAATLDAEPIAAGGARIGAVSVAATVDDALGETPRIDAKARAGATSAGPARLDAIEAAVSGALADLAVSLDAKGALEDGRALSLTARAGVDAAAPAPQITVTRLVARLDEAEAALRRPLRISAGAPLTVQGLDLGLPGGALTGEVTAHEGGLAGRLGLDFADLTPLARLAEAPLGSGSLEADARFDTRPGSAAATVAAAMRGLRLLGEQSDAGAFDATLDARWTGSRLTSETVLRGPFNQPVTLTASTPLRLSGGAPAFAPGLPVEGRLTWNGRIGDLWALVPAADHVLDGDVAIDLGFSGPAAAPALLGRVSLADGQYQNLETGTILTHMTLDGHAVENGGFTVDLDAEDGSGNPLALNAEIAGGQLRAQIDATRAVLVRRDDATAAISLDIAAVGPLAGPDISGDVTIDAAEVRLVNATPPSVADLGPVRIKGQPAPEPEAPAGEDIALDIRIRGDRDIFVRGRGLTSEWRVALDVGGAASAPIVTGEIERIRGELVLVGAVFDFTRGLIRFSGGQPIDPSLDIALLREAEDVTGGVVVRGYASDPQISFESTPALPEDEVLPRVLFNKSQQSLTAGESLQLAAGLATLLDGSGGFLDRVRATAGVDVLAVEGIGENTSVTVGKNLGEGVFVGAKQPLDGGPTRATVEIEVFDNVTVDSEVGAEGGSSFGLNWKKDF
ncbi:translocation/assembly module TamB domain-containing protein [Rubrimonas cliftonensis]|uniref:Translocation and assembly module TamB n=1 Tax=Rubrimonas cliftonensis TaxID=89524 RepID=A0A1H3VM89_9RHOB|nr:translocation/assembly module TamB domain-containing protein [Rubrimonas cliftonensis]SDZ75900.1 translocation and assembly module TamB [Rubrimonas cliftonensis]